MGVVVLRRFRSGEGPSASRVFRDDREARRAAEAWAAEGWHVEILARGRRDPETMWVESPDEMPVRAPGEDVPTGEAGS
jgi:hypothetical protein